MHRGYSLDHEYLSCFIIIIESLFSLRAEFLKTILSYLRPWDTSRCFRPKNGNPQHAIQNANPVFYSESLYRTVPTGKMLPPSVHVQIGCCQLFPDVLRWVY